ncbi:MAG: acylneuraminate cytidylyltransferase family protein [Planctomycetes bacterium]|nr:acylneuraminate cytidylyltransferase family protein [Planctomycetota bacterium]
MCRYVALIPARGASKAIPGKNLRPVAGQPLIAWAVAAAAACRALDPVYVATDSGEIRRAVESLGIAGVVVVDRRPETATDEATTESVMADFLVRHCPRDATHLVLIQATSPLLEARHLSEGLRRLESSGADSLVSVCRQKRFLWRAQGDAAVPVNYDPTCRPRRQDFAGYLVENGAFYISSVAGLTTSHCRLHGKIALYEMEPETYVEIDEPADLALVESLLLGRRRARGAEQGGAGAPARAVPGVRSRSVRARGAPLAVREER